MSSSTPSWRDIKQGLAGMDEKSLISLIHSLYTLNKENKEFLQGRIGGKEAYASLRENAARKIKQEFFPERGFGKTRIAPVKKAIQDYKKATGDPIGTADLTLLLIEQFVKFCHQYGGIEETKLESLSVAMEELYKILETCPAIIDVLPIDERLFHVKVDASYFGYGIEGEIDELIEDIGSLE